MNKHLTLASRFLKEGLRQIYLFHKDLKKNTRLFVYTVEALFAVIVLFFANYSHKDATVNTSSEQRTVAIAKVSDLMNKESHSPLLGTVVSVSEATVKSESSGKINKVYVSLGEKVSAGQTIAEFDNSQERAALLQAEGAYEAAKAARDISSISGGNSGMQLGESKNGALNTLNSAYNAFDDVIRVKTDGAYTDPRTNDVKLTLSTPDAALVYSLESQRRAIEQTLRSRDEKNRSLSVESDLISELTSVEKEAQSIKSYLDDLAKAYSKSLPNNQINETSLSASKAIVSAARTQITQTISQIQASRGALNSSIASKNISDKTSGDTGVTASDAQVKQALGAYEAALARYQKTIIRSPLTGTVNSLSVKTGDFVATFAQIAVISNNGSLEVRSYLNEDEVAGVYIGATSTVYKGSKPYTGTVTKVAEAIDPLTKKIEMRVALLDTTQKDILNGESVTLTITKAESKVSDQHSIKIPLSALKMTSNGGIVFNVVDGKTSQKFVEEGAIFGDMIEIKSGLTTEDVIVVDARGLKNETPVTVK